MSGEQLERRYRKLLRVVPKPYREVREEELLSVLMDGAAEGRQWPDVREALSLARLGMRVRLGETADGAQVRTQLGGILRAVAIAGSLLLSFVGAVQLAAILRTVHMNPEARWTWMHPFSETFPGGFSVSLVYAEVPAFWLAVLALIAVGWWRAAKVLAAVLFLLSAWQTSGTPTALQEETLLAAVVTLAIFGVRGVQAGPARIAGSAGVAVTLVLAAWVNGRFGAAGNYGRPALRALLALQAWGVSENRHVVVAAVAAVAVVCVVAYRSVAWPVALAVVTVAALGPVVAQGTAHPNLEGSDLVPLTFLCCALVAVAGLAVLRDRRT